VLYLHGGNVGDHARRTFLIRSFLGSAFHFADCKIKRHHPLPRHNAQMIDLIDWVLTQP
jgi:hypothetical protein